MRRAADIKVQLLQGRSRRTTITGTVFEPQGVLKLTL
jgi:hypothetical protein